MRNLKALALGAVFLGLASGHAQAGAIAASTILQDFNAVIFGDASTQSDIEGAAVVGGNFNGATVYNNPTDSNPNPQLPAGYSALTVYGNMTNQNYVNMDNGASAYVAGSHGPTNFNAGPNGQGSFSYTAPPNTIADFQTSLNALSTSLSQLSTTSTVATPTGQNQVQFNATPVNNIAVFNITSSQLSSFASLQMNLNGASTVIVNVSGSSIDFSANEIDSLATSTNVIWNFYQATSVSLGTAINGTVLATLANVTNQNQIDGGLFAQSWGGNGELHAYGFTGTLPGTTTTVATPEPASMTLLGAGLAGLGFIRRRKARKAA